MKTFASAVLVLGVALFSTGCGDKEEAKYVRPAAGCKCVEKKNAGKVQCNHCMGEMAQGKDALCYCGDGGCGCSTAGKTKCACGHCQGEADDPKCACNEVGQVTR